MFFVACLAGGILANKKEGFICIRQGADWGQRENDGSIFLFLKLKQNIQARRRTGASSDFQWLWQKPGEKQPAGI